MSAVAWRRRLPRLISVALGLLLVGQVAHWWTTSAPVRVQPVQRQAVARPQGSPAIAQASDNGLAFPLFGRSEKSVASSDASTPPPTSLGLELRGVLALGDGHGYALIDTGAAGHGAARPGGGGGSSGGKAADGLYAVGQAVVGPVKLYQVYADHVVLQTTHGLESLALKGEEIKAGARAATDHVPEHPAPNTHKAVLNLAQAHKVTQVLHNPMQFRRYLRVAPVRRNGRQVGYQVSPAGDPRLFSALGLRSGDVITAVNGTPLDGGALNTFELVKALHDAHEISLRVLRHGQEIPLQVVMQGQ